MPIHRAYNRNFFKKWSPEMAYILGFLFADGNIVRTKRNTHFVGWYSKDKDLLEKMRREMGSSHVIGERRSEKGSCFVLQIGSKELLDDLAVLGLTPNKSKRMELPKVPTPFMGDFIRGYFDGDGCVWVGEIHRKRKKKTLGILSVFTSASVDFLSGLLSLVRKLGISGGSLFKSKKGNYGRLSFSTRDSLKMYEIMYNDSTKLFLSRKKLVFEGFIQMRP